MIKVTHFPGYMKDAKPFTQETYIYNIDDIHHFIPGWGIGLVPTTAIVFSSDKEMLFVTETPEEINNLIQEYKNRSTNKTVLHHPV